MADPKAPGGDLKALDTRLRDLERRIRDKEVPSGTQKNLTTEKVREALERIEAQQLQIIAVQEQQAAQIAYLASLTVSSARSNTGLTTVPANSWSADANHRITLTNQRTTTGKLRITVSGTVGNAAILYSIDGQVNRDDLITGTGSLDSLNATSDGNLTVGASKTFTVSGLPLNTPLTVRTEVRSFGAVGLAGRVALIVEVIP